MLLPEKQQFLLNISSTSSLSYIGMVANPGKFQAIFLGTADNISIDIGSAKIVGSKQVKLLRVTIDRQLTFYPHITSECKRASAKFEALTQNQADHLYMALYHVFF